MIEKLAQLILEQKYVKAFPEEDEPQYTTTQKEILAWSIAWEGSIRLDRTRRIPRINITNTEFELLEKIQKIVKLGKVSNRTYKPHGFGKKPTKKWHITSYREILFFLQNIEPYMPSNRKRKIAQLVIEYIQSRLRKHESNLPLDCDKRELEILEEVQRLNKRGL